MKMHSLKNLACGDIYWCFEMVIFKTELDLGNIFSKTYL